MSALFSGGYPLTTLRTPPLPPHLKNSFTLLPPPQSRHHSRISFFKIVRVSNGDSYLDMWKVAVERDWKLQEFERIAENPAGNVGEGESPDDVEKKTRIFEKLLEVPKEERDRVQSLQVIDRAAAAISAARALIKEKPQTPKEEASPRVEPLKTDALWWESHGYDTPELMRFAIRVLSLTCSATGCERNWSVFDQSGVSGLGTPGPDFWSWSPPEESKQSINNVNKLQVSTKRTSQPNPVNPVMEKDQSNEFLELPLESVLLQTLNPPLPPLQMFMEVEKVDSTDSSLELSLPTDEHEIGVLFSSHAGEAVEALHKADEDASQGVNPDGSRWWRETGIERRPAGVVCKWTLTRGVSADEGVEWEEKFWEAADHFDYKELGSEKSGRDAAGNVWREYWKESMWQDLKSGLVHIEKSADKWGKSGKSDEWQEQWWEHYDAAGQVEKWAHKWCSIDPYTPLEAGHAHVWHERWGEKYDGRGGSMKYTDKWAERLAGDGWTKWGDKWDENFYSNSHGVKQGEAWWEGKNGEQWNRTWGEQHNGSGWVHKYGKSSSGEHWDTHVQQETWYERYPHYGFDLSFKNSVQLREVRKHHETS